MVQATPARRAAKGAAVTHAPPTREEATLPAFDLDDWEAWHASAAAEAGMSVARPTDWRRALIVVILLAAFVALAVYAFEGPVAREWYHARQTRLASEFATPHGRPPVGGVASLLQVPSLHLSVYVVEGDGPTQLRGAPGHRTSTPFPGARGNSVVMGHQHGWGGPFADLYKLQRAHKLNLNTPIYTQVAPGKPVTVFKVQQVAQVAATDTHLLGPSTDHRLTLVTQSSGGKRLVVVAVSGTTGKLSKRHVGIRPITPGPALLFDATTAFALIAFGAALAAAVYMGRRFRILAVVAVVLPLAAAGLFCALLELDRVLPPLR